MSEVIEKIKVRVSTLLRGWHCGRLGRFFLDGGKIFYNSGMRRGNLFERYMRDWIYGDADIPQAWKDAMPDRDKIIGDQDELIGKIDHPEFNAVGHLDCTTMDLTIDWKTSKAHERKDYHQDQVAFYMHLDGRPKGQVHYIHEDEVRQEKTVDGVKPGEYFRFMTGDEEIDDNLMQMKPNGDQTEYRMVTKKPENGKSMPEKYYISVVEHSVDIVDVDIKRTDEDAIKSWENMKTDQPTKCELCDDCNIKSTCSLWSGKDALAKQAIDLRWDIYHLEVRIDELKKIIAEKITLEERNGKFDSFSLRGLGKDRVTVSQKPGKHKSVSVVIDKAREEGN